ncbi:Copia protein, partial [Mucuna pruriens]
MKELGKLKYFLKIEVTYSKQGIFISQKKYVLDLLKEIRKLGCKTLGIPIEQNHRIGCEEIPTIEKSQYQRLVGKLIYLFHTRLDIAFVSANLYMIPRKDTFKQLKGSSSKSEKRTIFHKIRYIVHGNIDYAGSVVDRRSTFGYCMFLGGNLVTWRSKKQNVVARSSAEIEFRAMAYSICEGLWMKIIIDDLKVKYKGSIKLFCDNNSTISISHNPVQHNRTKYIEINRHFIKKKLNNGLVVTAHVSIGLHVADVFTKGLPIVRFQELNGKLGMINIHLPT